MREKKCFCGGLFSYWTKNKYKCISCGKEIGITNYTREHSLSNRKKMIKAEEKYWNEEL